MRHGGGHKQSSLMRHLINVAVQVAMTINGTAVLPKEILKPTTSGMKIMLMVPINVPS